MVLITISSIQAYLTAIADKSAASIYMKEAKIKLAENKAEILKSKAEIITSSSLM